MFEETTLFGISMAPRAHRRALVVLTYTALLVLMSAMPFFVFFRPDGWLVVVAYFVASIWWVMLMLIGRGLFGRFVRSGFRQFVGPPRGLVQTRLGLAASAPEDERVTDEREVAVRDHAYRLAYNGLAVATVFAFFVLKVLVDFVPRAGMLAVTLAMILFTIVAFTLPQAVVLWTEPDLDIG